MTFLYDDIPEMPRSVAEQYLRAGSPRDVAFAILALGIHGHDWNWVQQECAKLLSHPSEQVVTSALVSIGHLVRRSKCAIPDLLASALEGLKKDPRFSGRVSDVLDDIAIFVHNE